jgi:hypothetical protein
VPGPDGPPEESGSADAPGPRVAAAAAVVAAAVAAAAAAVAVAAVAAVAVAAAAAAAAAVAAVAAVAARRGDCGPTGARCWASRAARPYASAPGPGSVKQESTGLRITHIAPFLSFLSSFFARLYTHTHTYIYIYICMYVCIYIYLYTCVCLASLTVINFRKMAYDAFSTRATSILYIFNFKLSVDNRNRRISFFITALA